MPIQAASLTLPSGGEAVLVVFGAIVACSNPNPAFVLILAALAPPLADPHTAPWPLLPPSAEIKILPLSVRARDPLYTHAADLQGGHFSH